MGYPMTWRRVIARNGLATGGYGKPPDSWTARVNINERDDDLVGLGKYRRERLLAYEIQSGTLAGDLRRLEDDALDEAAICKAIERQTGIDHGTIAAVLQAFLRDI